MFRRAPLLPRAALVGLLMVSAAGLRMVEAAPADQTATAAIDTFQFMPRSLEVTVETKVVWTNNDDVTHTVTSGTPDQRTDLFNATLNGKGAKFEFTFSTPGTFTYFCNRHQQMRGEIKVTE